MWRWSLKHILLIKPCKLHNYVQLHHCTAYPYISITLTTTIVSTSKLFPSCTFIVSTCNCMLVITYCIQNPGHSVWFYPYWRLSYLYWIYTLPREYLFGESNDCQINHLFFSPDQSLQDVWCNISDKKWWLACQQKNWSRQFLHSAE